MQTFVPSIVCGGGAMALAYATHALSQIRWAVLAGAALSGLLVLPPVGSVFAQEVASTIAVAEGDALGAVQVVRPAAVVRPPVILRREGNLLTALVMPAAEEPGPSNSSLRPSANEVLRPRAITHYGGYGSGYQGIYGSGHGEGDGHCDLYFVTSGGWCPTVTVTGAPTGAP